jgi:Uncharacterized protein conserved in bacteria
MEFEWDESKRNANIEKHKIDFVDAVRIYDDYVWTFQNLKADRGEERFVPIGIIYDIVEIALVYTPREGRRRIISARRARKDEREKYYEERNCFEADRENRGDDGPGGIDGNE